MSDQPIYVQIRDLEVQQARAVREYLLGDATALARLKDIDAKIVALRAQLAGE